MYKKATSELIKSLHEYRQHLERGEVSLIAKETQVDQSQVSRILNGDFKVVSKSVIKICRYANICTDGHSSKDTSSLLNAIEEVWDGSKEIEGLLLRLILSVKPISARSDQL